jgi:TPR repeat protein
MAQAAPRDGNANCRPFGTAKAAPRHYAQALKTDADEGSVEAMTTLGVMYARGIGVAKNTVRSEASFRTGSHPGISLAMVNLGTLHAVDVPTRRNAGEHAYAWLRAALYVGVADSERDSTVFKLGMVAGRLDLAQVKRAEAQALQLARAAVASQLPAAGTDKPAPSLDRGLFASDRRI